MSGRCTGWVLRHGPLDRAMRMVLVTIADAANTDGEHAHPGIANMIEGSLYSRGTVNRVVRRLIAEGWVEVESQGGGRGHSTVYRVLMETASPRRGSPEKPRHLAAETALSGAETASSAYLDLSPTVNPTVEPNGLKPLSANADVDAVFAAWQSSTGKTRARLDPKRERLIRARLRDYPADDLVIAVNGWKFSPHHRGENERGTVYNDLELLLRDAAHVERFRDLALNGPSLVPAGGHRPSNVQRGLAALAAPNPWEDLFDGQEDPGPPASRANGQLSPAPDGGP